jgi:predicted small secreted protein
MWRKLFFLVLLAALFAAPCEAARGARQKAARGRPEVVWLFDTHEDRDGNPRTKVFLVIGERRVLLTETAANFSVLDRKDFKGHAVPAAAITACSGWWAGAGEDLYVIRRNGSLIVYSRDLDEQAPASRYKRLKVIPTP